MSKLISDFQQVFLEIPSTPRQDLKHRPYNLTMIDRTCHGRAFCSVRTAKGLTNHSHYKKLMPLSTLIASSSSFGTHQFVLKLPQGHITFPRSIQLTFTISMNQVINPSILLFVSHRLVVQQCLDLFVKLFPNHRRSMLCLLVSFPSHPDCKVLGNLLEKLGGS